MTNRLPAHTLMTTFLGDRLRHRDITVEHLADLLQPILKCEVQSWIAGWSSPAPSQLTALANALHVDPVELLAGWLIDNAVVEETTIWDAVLGPVASAFPRSDFWDLIAPRKRPDMSAGDPHDERPPSPVSRPDGVRIKKTPPALRKPEGAP